MRPATILNSATDSRLRRGLHHHAVQFVETAHDLRQLRGGGLHLLQASVQGGGSLEIEIGRGVVALPLDLAHQRLPVGFEKLLHASHFGGVFLVGASLEAGRQAHLHLGINAAGKLRDRDGDRRRSGAS